MGSIMFFLWTRSATVSTQESYGLDLGRRLVVVNGPERKLMFLCKVMVRIGVKCELVALEVGIVKNIQEWEEAVMLCFHSEYVGMLYKEGNEVKEIIVVCNTRLLAVDSIVPILTVLNPILLFVYCCNCVAQRRQCVIQTTIIFPNDYATKLEALSSASRR